MAGGYLGNIYNSQQQSQNGQMFGNNLFEKFSNTRDSNNTKYKNIINNPAIGALIGVFSVLIFFLALFGLYKFVEYMRN